MTKVYHSRKSDEWGTPAWLFECFSDLFPFCTDVAATKDNSLCVEYYDLEWDGLAQDWTEKVCWMNPPYSQVARWIEKAATSAACTVALVPSRTDTRWFQDYVLGVSHYFVPGRLRFGDSKNSAPFPSVIVLFNNHIQSDFERVFELACWRVGKRQNEKKRNSKAGNPDGSATTSETGGVLEGAPEEEDESLQEIVNRIF